MTRELKIEQPFDLEMSLTMGQAFRWRPFGDGWFSGVLGENLIHIRRIENGVEYRAGGPDGERAATDADDELLRRYFREDDDIAAIYADISRDPVVARLVEKYWGMRVLRQEPWECLVSYICSRSNTIPNIRKCVSEIVTLTRQTVRIGDDEQDIFPTKHRLLEIGEDGLFALSLSGRFSRDFPSAIYAAAQRSCDGDLNLDELTQLSYPETKRRLRECHGIGDKIADCVALMALDKLGAFPVDTHIRRLVASLWFGGGRPPSDAKIVQWAQGHFGKYAGYAGQFLFCDRERTGNSEVSRVLWGQVGDSTIEPQPSPARNMLRYPNRGYSCPECGAEAGKVCRSPSGYRYEVGHRERGPRL